MGQNNTIIVEDFHGHQFPNLSLNLEGEICCHGLCPLQSITKNLDQGARALVWMGGVHHTVPWMVTYVIENKPELLQKSGNKLVCIVIPCGNPKLDSSNNLLLLVDILIM